MKAGILSNLVQMVAIILWPDCFDGFRCRKLPNCYRPNLYRSKCSLAADHDARDRSIALWKRLGAKSSFWGYQWGYFLDLH